MRHSKNRLPELRQDKILHAIAVVIWAIILLITLYPLYLTVIASFSDPDMVYKGEVTIWIKGFSTRGYDTIFKYKEMWNAYLNTAVYTILGTLLSVSVTMMAAYALSKQFPLKGLINFLFVLVMFFSGGLIPTFVTINNLGLYNTRAMMIINGCITTWNLMIARTYIKTSIPEEMYEAAEMEGASHFTYFIRILVPLSSTIIAVLTIYYAVGKWNDYYTGLIYLKDRNKLPLQTLLREILTTLQVSTNDFEQYMSDVAGYENALKVAQIAKYCIIVVSTVPAVMLYILMQKNFVKGVMIGAIKG